MGMVKALLLDVGGVMMTNGWDRKLRRRTAETFGVDYDAMTDRHHLIFDTYETGKITFDEYLKQIMFFEERTFSITEVKEFILNAVEPFQDVMDYIREVKKAYGLKVGVVSNEGRELAVDRIARFDLPSFVDFFVVSSFVHYRKPDADIYRLAIDVVQVPPSEIVYIDDRELLIEIGRGLGLQGVHHKDLETTQGALEHLLNQN